jgi:hypothetical protein
MNSYASLVKSIRGAPIDAYTQAQAPKVAGSMNKERAGLSKLILDAFRAGKSQLIIDLVDNFPCHAELVSGDQITLLDDERKRITTIIKQYIIDRRPPRISFNEKLRVEHRRKILAELEADKWIFYQYDYSGYGAGDWSRCHCGSIDIDTKLTIMMCRDTSEIRRQKRWD